MELKKKLITVGCAAALASMMAAPAFAADVEEKDVEGPAPLNSPMVIKAEVSNSTNLISVTVPTVMPINIFTNPSGGTGAEGSFASASNISATIKNRSTEILTNDYFAIETKVEAISDPKSLLADVHLYLKDATAAVDQANKLEVGVPKSLVEVPAAVKSGTIVKDGEAAINLEAADAKSGAKLAILGADAKVSAEVQTMITVTKKA